MGPTYKEDLPEGVTTRKSPHMSEIIDRHFQLLEATEKVISQLGTKAYNLGDDVYTPAAEGGQGAVDAPPHSYPAQYMYLLDRQEVQVAQLEQLVNSFNAVI